jgi:perosamine synthetase
MVTTDDPELAEYVRRCRLHGMSRDAWKRYVPGAGWRTRSRPRAEGQQTDAAIGRAQLRHFPDWQARRDEITARYDLGLKGIEGIALPARPSTGRHAWHLYVLRVLPSFGPDRDSFIAELAARGVSCSVHFIPLHQLPYLRELDDGGGTASRWPTRYSSRRRCPLHACLDDEVDRVPRRR